MQSFYDNQHKKKDKKQDIGVGVVGQQEDDQASNSVESDSFSSSLNLTSPNKSQLLLL